jgi:hypothetical protein
MGDNQNSSTELGLYPRINPMPLSSIAKLSALGTGLETTAETQNGASKTTSEIDKKNWIEEQFISSQAFHRTPGERVWETTAGEQFKPRILESFDPVTQVKDRQSSATIHTRIEA